MFTTHSLQTLSFYNDILQVAWNCMNTNRTAIVMGATRSGGSILGQWLVQTIASLESDDEARSGIYYQIGWDGSYSTLIRSLLRRVSSHVPLMGDRDAVANTLIESLKKTKCRLLYIDEADRASAEVIRELFRIQDLAARADFPFGVMLFGHRQPEEWCGKPELGGGKVRYHRVLPQIGVAEIAAILEAWCPRLTKLSEKFDGNDRRVRGGITLLEQNGGNRIGVLEDYAVMLNGEFRNAQFGAPHIQAILDHADSPVKGLPERIEQLELRFG
jgi:hypothetical protein